MTDDELINKFRGVVKEEIQTVVKQEIQTALKTDIRDVVRQEIKAAVDPINKRLDGQQFDLRSIAKRLDDPEHGLEAMNHKIDALTGEMIEVRELAGSTHDLVSIIKDKHEEELDEIRAHTHMLPAHRVSLKV